VEDIKNMNKQYRGQIMRIIALFYPPSISIKQIKMSLTAYGINYQADVDKHLFYLESKGYIKRLGETNKLSKDDDFVEITAKGIDLIEGTISDEGLLL
jgi:DNA-binding MarR family transcriptional regulator